MSKIEWTEKTWNPTIGCTEVSPGCTNCYAAKMAFRLSHIPSMKEDYAGLTKRLPNGKIVWTGVVKYMHDRLIEPLKVKKPTVWFVDSMSDLFHADVPFEFIDKVFVIMKLASRHTFQVLTKRADRMAEYFSADRPQILDATMMDMMENDEVYGVGSSVCYVQKGGLINWPLHNVWLGVSVENQKAADERVPYLSTIPARVRFLSCEPLLGEVNLYPYLNLTNEQRSNNPGSSIDWIITGGESGSGARSMHPDWVRGLRDQCKDAGVAFFFKQWGEYLPALDGDKEIAYAFNDGLLMVKPGKKKAGRLLDGVLYDEFPKIKDI